LSEIGKNWKQEREYWALLLVERNTLANDEYGDPIAFESVEEAKQYTKEKKLVSEDRELASTRQEAQRGGVKVVIVPVRVLTRSL
jgi:hypothetical protein